MRTVDPSKESWGSPIASPHVSKKSFRARRRGERDRSQALEVERSRSERKIEAELLKELWADWLEP